MPRRDGTGPLGLGARTGRGMGNCGRSIATIATTCLGLALEYKRRGGSFSRLINKDTVTTKEELMNRKNELEAEVEKIDDQISKM